MVDGHDDDAGYGVDHLVGHAGIDADPEGVAHDAVGIGKRSDDAKALARAAHLVKAGVSGQISRKQTEE